MSPLLLLALPWHAFPCHRGQTLYVFALLHRRPQLRRSTELSVLSGDTTAVVLPWPRIAAAAWPLLTFTAPPLVQLTFLNCTALHGLKS